MRRAAALRAGQAPWLAQTGLVVRAPAISLAEAAARIDVSARALGAGYIAFFLYSFAIGVLAVILTFAVARRTPPAKA